MKKEAEMNAESDKKAREEADKINQADAMIFQTEKQLNEYGSKISAANKEAIQKALSDLKDAHKEKDLAKIDTALAAMNTAWSAASQEIYQAQQEQANASNTTTTADTNGSEKQDGEVTDVDFEEVKDDKKK
jgi:molecular chaperone DnaK